MTSTYKRLKRRRAAGEIDGFTLIELLIVIVVLGILAAVVIFALGGVTGKSQLAACQADGATVSTAIAAFHANNPGEAADSALLTATTGNGASSAYIQSWPNATSYAYSLDTKANITLATGNPPAAGTLYVDSATNGAPKADGWIPYTGPKSCISIGL